jgi:hypothetical protein
MAYCLLSSCASMGLLRRCHAFHALALPSAGCRLLASCQFIAAAAAMDDDFRLAPVFVFGGEMKRIPFAKISIVLLILASFGLASQASAQQASLLSGLVEGTTGGLTDSLAGYALTAIGLNSQAATQTAIADELNQINLELNTISSQLSTIQGDLQTQTCVDALSSSAVTDALTSIATVSNTYTNLLEAGENASGTVSPSNINNFITQVVAGPGGGLPPIGSALTAINIALQSTDNDGIIGVCERAVTSIPETGSFGADIAFYDDPVNLLQYFADYQTVATLLLVEYYNYEAFFNSPYYSATTLTNGLPANQAAEICQNPTGETSTECGFARSALEQLYVYLQNQYSVNGVPYSTKDSSGNLQTGLYLAGNNANYLFAASIEEFTNAEDPSAHCPSVMESSKGCGLAYSENPFTNPFWSDLAVYQYETAWVPATPEMWRAVLNSWVNGSSSQTLANGLTALGFQNAADKVILTQTTYSATPKVSSGTDESLFPFTSTALCYMDTSFERSFSIQPFCYNGESDNVSYGSTDNLLWLWDTYNGGGCLTFRNNGPVLSTTSYSAFYGPSATYESDLNTFGDQSNGCSADAWIDGEPGWLVNNQNQSGTSFFWPAIDESGPTCGANLSFGLLQPAITRIAINSVGVPTMCGADFDRYFADNVAPRNPYQQIVFTTAPLTGAGNASLGPITIEMEDTSSGTAKPLTSTSDIVVDMSTTSTNGFFTLTQNTSAKQANTVTIPAGQSSATFYYTDGDQGTPQITADPGTMVPGVQNEIISSDAPSPMRVRGRARHAGSNNINGKINIQGRFAVLTDIQLERATLTFRKMLSEDASAGELVRQGNGTPLNLPVALGAIRGSKANSATYDTPTGVLPRIHVAITDIKRKPGQANFQIDVEGAEIDNPGICSKTQSSTVLHTQMIANDGTHPAAALDVNLHWSCPKAGRLYTLPGQTVSGADGGKKRSY